MAPPRWPAARAGRHASPTGCSSACATTPTSAAPASSTSTPPTPHSTSWRSTTSAWTASTARSSTAICTKFDGGPVGLSTLAVTVGEEQDTIEDVYEPYLLQCGFLKRTPRGRVATSRAYTHLGLDVPESREPGLF